MALHITPPAVGGHYMSIASEGWLTLLETATA